MQIFFIESDFLRKGKRKSIAKQSGSPSIANAFQRIFKQVIYYFKQPKMSKRLVSPQINCQLKCSLDATITATVGGAMPSFTCMAELSCLVVRISSAYPAVGS